MSLKHIWILSLISLAMTGCMARLNVTNYPGFFHEAESYHSIAVASVQNNAEPNRYVSQLNQDLVGLLRNNGYYYVNDYTQSDADDNELLSSVYGSSDLALFSTLTGYGEEYDSRINTRKESMEVYAVDEDGDYIYDEDGRRVIDHIEYYDVDYTVYEMTSYADMYVQVINVQTGESLYSKSKRGSCYDEDEDPDNLMSVNHGRWCALDDALSREVYQVCPTQETISVKINDVMGIYRLTDKNEWEEDDVFKPGDMMKVTLWFPKEALYNNFSFDIVYETQQVVPAQNVYWEGQTFGFEYSIDSLVEAGGGIGKYYIRLWNGDQVAFDKTFKVKE